MLDKFFKLSDHNTNVHTELVAGVTTFLTMSYILFVQPAVLSTDFAGNPTGLSMDAVLLATCLASFIATLIMGLYANYPIAQAPGMGENFFFITVVMALAAKGIANPAHAALGVVLVAGVIFLVLSLVRAREAIIDAVSPSLKNGIAVGIGLFIAFIGLKNAGVIVASKGTFVTLNPNLAANPDMWIFFGILLLTAILQTLRVPGSILIGIVVGTGVSLLMGKVKYGGFYGLPRDHAFFKCDVKTVWNSIHLLWPYILIFLFMDMFDTVGTLIGVSEQAGFIKDNKLPRANRALVSDAIGTVAGAAMGTSTVTSFIESAAGVEQGGRTGLTSVFTAALFLLAIFFTPLFKLVGSYAPITAPALVIVGAMMMRNVSKIPWDDYSEAIPSFLIILGIPLCFSIADGLAMGLIAYPIVKLFSGKGKGVHWLSYVVAAAFVARYIWVHIG